MGNVIEPSFFLFLSLLFFSLLSIDLLDQRSLSVSFIQHCKSNIPHFLPVDHQTFIFFSCSLFLNSQHYEECPPIIQKEVR